MSYHFKNTWDWVSRSLTLITLTVVGVSLYSLHTSLPVKTIAALFGLCLLIFIIRLLPLSYTVNDEFLQIHKLGWTEQIALKDILNIQAIPPQNHLPLRWGTQGVFGYLGYLGDGTVSMTTSLRHNVLVNTVNRKLIISPRDSQQMVAYIQKKITDTTHLQKNV